MKLNLSRFINVKNVWRAAAVLLSSVMFTSYFSSGLYAKYSTGVEQSDEARVAQFSYTAKVNNVSALSFTNTDFWGGDENSQIAMNALRSVDFTLSNYKEIGENKVQLLSEVPMTYKLEFIAPQSFVQNLAIQLFDGAKNALLPQIVVADLMSKSNGGTYDTSTSTNYNEVTTEEKTFTINVDEGVYTATTEDITVKIEPIVRENVEQTVYFRTWDVSKITTQSNPTITTEQEGCVLESPLVVNYTVTAMPCYKIVIDMPQFTLPLGVATTHNYGIRLVTTKLIQDEHLGRVMVGATDDSLREVYQGQSVRTKRDESTYSQPFTITSVCRNVQENGSVVTKYYTAQDKLNLYGADNLQDLFISKCYAKNFPMNVKVLFEQVD